MSYLSSGLSYSMFELQLSAVYLRSFFSQFLLMFRTTYGWKSVIIQAEHFVHFLIASPAIPTPALIFRTNFDSKSSLFRITYRAAMTPLSHSFRPSKPCGKTPTSEMSSFILYEWWRIIERTLSWRTKRCSRCTYYFSFPLSALWGFFWLLPMRAMLGISLN